MFKEMHVERRQTAGGFEAMPVAAAAMTARHTERGDRAGGACCMVGAREGDEVKTSVVYEELKRLTGWMWSKMTDCIGESKGNASRCRRRDFPMLHSIYNVNGNRS